MNQEHPFMIETLLIPEAVRVVRFDVNTAKKFPLLAPMIENIIKALGLQSHHNIKFTVLVSSDKINKHGEKK